MVFIGKAIIQISLRDVFYVITVKTVSASN